MISNRKKTKQPNTVDIIAFQLKIILQTLKGKLKAIFSRVFNPHTIHPMPV